jgi:hypothetical protein
LTACSTGILHRLGVHVAEQVFGNDLGRLATSRAGIAGKTAAFRRDAERRWTTPSPSKVGGLDRQREHRLDDGRHPVAPFLA